MMDADAELLAGLEAVQSKIKDVAQNLITQVLEQAIALAPLTANCYREMFEHLIAKGFDREEAMRLLLANNPLAALEKSIK